MKASSNKEKQPDNELFRMLAENSLDIIHILDDKGSVIYINPAVTRILGYTEEEMLGKIAFSFVHPDDLPKVNKTFSEIVKKPTKSKTLEMRIRHKNGSWITFEVASKPFPAPSGKLQFIMNSRDITEKKKLEQQKEEFLSMVAHELKTPITAMKLVVKYIHIKCQQMNASQKILEKIESIDGEISRLTELINDILESSRLESGRIILTFTTFDLNQLIKKTISELQPIATQKLVFTELSAVKLKADKDRIKQVLVNLLSNAIKYSNTDGTIKTTITAEKESVTVSIQDEGEGIPEEKIPLLFNRFYQSKQGSAGTGLGLYISKEIIKRHKGKMWVESELGKGSIFYFSLPHKK